MKPRRQYLHALVRVSGVYLNGPDMGKPIEFNVCTHYIEDGRVVPDREHFDWLVQVANAKAVEP